SPSLPCVVTVPAGPMREFLADTDAVVPPGGEPGAPALAAEMARVLGGEERRPPPPCRTCSRSSRAATLCRSFRSRRSSLGPASPHGTAPPHGSAHRRPPTRPRTARLRRRAAPTGSLPRGSPLPRGRCPRVTAAATDSRTAAPTAADD